MINNFNSKYFIIFAICFSLFFGVILRLYNLNYDNLWFDEIASFWVSDPFISLSESYERNRLAESQPFLFNYLLKLTHKVFGYTSYVGRYFTATFGILSIISITYLSRLLKRNNSFVLVAFLVSFNVFLIKYSQEARVYAFLFFICSLSIIFLIKSFKSYDSGENLFSNTSLYILFQSLAFLTHPFSIIFFFSLIAYYFFYYLKYRKNLVFLNYSILLLLIFLAIYLPIYLGEVQQFPSWIEQPDLKFFTNFYFSTFFGSRLLGLIHLILLLSLIFCFRNKIIKNINLITLLIIFIFLSYFTPLLYGWLIKPVIFSRYIIFVLIPIIIVLSYLIYEIEREKIKNLLILTIVFLTFGNQFSESNFKQFYEVRPKYKPDYYHSLKTIYDSEHKKYFINHSFLDKKNFWSDVFNNYFRVLSKENNFILTQLNFDDLRKEDGYIWIICPQDISIKNCEKIRSKKLINFKVSKNINFNNVNVKLVKLK